MTLHRLIELFLFGEEGNRVGSLSLQNEDAFLSCTAAVKGDSMVSPQKITEQKWQPGNLYGV